MAKKSILSMMAVLCCLVYTFAQQSILVLNSTTDTVLQLSATDGSVLNPLYIDLNTSASPGTPKGLAQVDNKLWISDQITDAVFIYSITGTYESTISGGLDNIRGLNVVNNEVWVTNAGSANGATANTIVRYSKAGSLLGTYPAITSPFDVLDLGDGNALVSSFSNSGIQKISYDGTTTSSFVGAGVVSNPEQLNFNSSGNVIAAVFSSLGTNPAGVYEFSSSGAILNKWAVSSGSVRGVIQADNGNYLVSTSTGVYSLNPTTSALNLVVAGNMQFFTRIDTSLAAVNENSGSSVRFYPNPVKDFLHISSREDISSAAVYSLAGQILINQKVNGKSARIDLSTLSAGIYLVKIQNTNSKWQTIKILKN